MADHVQAQKGEMVTLAGLGKLMLEKSEAQVVLEPKEDCDKNIFWDLLRERVARKITLGRIELEGKMYVKLDDTLFDASGTVTLFQEEGGIKAFGVEDVVFYSEVVHSPTYLAYANRAVKNGKEVLRRRDV
ncbi:unnamed protein product [Gongylonema pulchrum]|uniref:Ribonuclease PH n=1 Tax=Gongylonema pulchrum TaxID=637853 RepID=A0A183EM13_9BILA|nr:unnamed protein product [Gongylonema pulchrum]